MATTTDAIAQSLPTLNGDDSALHENLCATATDECLVQVFNPGEEQGGAVLGEGDCLLVNNFLDITSANTAFARLDSHSSGTDDNPDAKTSTTREIAYQQWYHMPDPKKEKKGKLMPLQPLTRVKVAQTSPPNEEGKVPHYRFPVNRQSAHGTTLFTPTVQRIRDQVQALLDVHITKKECKADLHLNHAVVLLYRDGEDRIGLHKDKLLDLDEDAPICSVSLGQPRVYVLQDNIHAPTRRQEITLAHGTLLVLGPETNKHWYHSIRSMTKTEQESALASSQHQHRISVTMRAVTTFLNPTTGEVSGKGAAHDTLDWPVELRGVHRSEESENAAERPILRKEVN